MHKKSNTRIIDFFKSIKKHGSLTFVILVFGIGLLKCFVNYCSTLDFNFQSPNFKEMILGPTNPKIRDYQIKPKKIQNKVPQQYYTKKDTTSIDTINNEPEKKVEKNQTDPFGTIRLEIDTTKKNQE